MVKGATFHSRLHEIIGEDQPDHSDLQDWSNKTYWMFIASHGRTLFDTLDTAVPLALANMKRQYDKANEEDRMWMHPNTLAFLDVGCGPGNILQQVYGYLTHKFRVEFPDRDKRPNIQVTGIEHDVRLAKIADESRCGTIYNIDAFKFEGYNKYDIIYYYRPIKDSKLGVEMEEMIRKRAKPGSIIIPNFAHKGGGCKKTDKLLFKDEYHEERRIYDQAFQKYFRKA